MGFNGCTLPCRVNTRQNVPIEFVTFCSKFDIFSFDPNKIAVVVGTNSLSRGGTSYPVKRFIVHRNYIERILANDIGMIRVKYPIEFNKRVRPVTISPKAVPANTELIVTGQSV